MASVSLRKLRTLMLVSIGLAGASIGDPGSAATALTPVKIGILKAGQTIVLFHAASAGFTEKEGISAEITALNNGPAVVSAVMGGAFDVGFAATTAIVFARNAGQPIKLFGPISLETVDHPSAWIVAAQSNPIRSIVSPQLQGHVVVSGNFPDLGKDEGAVMDGLFSSETWLAGHAEVASRITRALHGSAVQIAADPELLKSLLESELKLDPAVAAASALWLDTRDGPITAEQIKITTDELQKIGLLKTAVSPAGIIFPTH